MNTVFSKPLFLMMKAYNCALIISKTCICTGVQRLRQTGNTQMERLDGFLPTAESWHAKICLMMVIVQILNARYMRFIMQTCFLKQHISLHCLLYYQ